MYYRHIPRIALLIICGVEYTCSYIQCTYYRHIPRIALLMCGVEYTCTCSYIHTTDTFPE